MKSKQSRSWTNFFTEIAAALVVLFAFLASGARAASAPRKSGIKWIMDRSIYNSKGEQPGELEDLIVRNYSERRQNKKRRSFPPTASWGLPRRI
jgi:hypothetical protein